MESSNIFRVLFKGACFVAAVTMVCYWMYEFAINDEDLSLVEYKTFHETDVMLPEVSLCIENPFIQKRLEDINTTISISTYLEFLKGDIFDEQMKDIDYDNVTFSLSDYLLDSTIGWNNGSFLTYTSENDTVNKGTYTTYNGFLHGKFVKCFASKLNNQYKGYFHWFQILYIQNNFLNGLTSSSGNGLFVVLHYPKQFLLSTKNVKFFSKTRANSRVSFIMSFYLKDMEILNRRNKRKEQCILEWECYDDLVLERHFDMIGCRAPYQQSSKELPICNTKENMRKAMYLTSISHTGKHPPPPCQVMSRLNFDYEEFDLGQHVKKNRGQFFGLQYHIPDQFKLIKQSKSITIQSALGYIGGYIGLFLGRYT